MGVRTVRLVAGAALLALACAVAVVVAACGGGVEVALAWPALGLAWRPTALVLFLLGAGALLLAEAAVRLLLRALPPRRARPGGRRAAR